MNLLNKIKPRDNVSAGGPNAPLIQAVASVMGHETFTSPD